MLRRNIRVLLDANVWRYIVDESAAAVVERDSNRRGIDLLVAPSVVLEGLRTSNARLRRQLAELVTRPA